MGTHGRSGFNRLLLGSVTEKVLRTATCPVRVNVREDERLVSYLKGAPEVLLGRCELSNDDRESWTEKAAAYAQEGRVRVLAVAWGPGEAEAQLSLLGLALFWDPPRPEVPDAVRRRCRRAFA